MSLIFVHSLDPLKSSSSYFLRDIKHLQELGKLKRRLLDRTIYLIRFELPCLVFSAIHEHLIFEYVIGM